MDRIRSLEKEIVDLRKSLQLKETELYQMKKEWTPIQQKNGQEDLEYIQLDPDNEISTLQCSRLPKWAIERYSRQILLPYIGVEGQKRLCGARVLVVGAGGLGCPAAAYLAGAGVGEIGIVDYDTVDLTNIHRQILHSESDEHMCKVDSAADALRKINSRITITPYNVQLDSSNALQIASKYHVVLDCTDNVPTRYLLNDVCVLSKLPLISGSALQMEGQLTIYGYRAEKNSNEVDQSHVGPCYRCLFATPPPAEAVGSCSANGVAGPVPGAIGALQALEAIKYIVGQPRSKLLVERMIIFDGEDMTFRCVKLRPRNPECAACSSKPTLTQLVDYEAFCKSKAKEKKRLEAKLKSERRREEKERRMAGQSYLGFRATKRDANAKPKWVQDVPKSERKIGPACKSKLCANPLVRNCRQFTEEDRQNIFCFFWNDIDWKGKKKYLRSLIDSVSVKRRRTVKIKGDVSRKQSSKVYHLFNKEEKRLPVCRVMFLNTLGVKEAMVRWWLLKEDTPKTPKKPYKALNVDSYIETLPKSPPKCLFCKNTVNIQYINMENINNFSQLYSKYKKDMKDKGIEPASRKTFTKVYNAKNLRIFKAKNESDVCDLNNQHNVYKNVEVSDVDCNNCENNELINDSDLELDILQPANRITPTELASKLYNLKIEPDSDHQQRHLLVDVRSEPEFGMCQIDGAVNYPIDKLRAENLDKLLEEIRKCTNQVIFICRRGNDSQVAAQRVLEVIEKEHSNKIADLAGGLHAWSKDVDRDFPVY